MIENGRISSFQMAVMMYPTIVATALLVLPNITAHSAGRDMWLSPFWGAIMGLITVFIAWQLNKLYPKETIIEYSVTICGKWLGKLLGLLFILFYLHVNGIIIREYSDFIVGTFLIKTPSIVVIAGMIFVSGLAVRGGIEVLARCAEFFGPVVTVLFLVIIILLIPVLDPSKLFPMFEHGIKPSLLGAASPQAWFSEYFLIAFLLPYIVDRDQAFKWATLSVIAVMLTLMVTNFERCFYLACLVKTLRIRL